MENKIENIGTAKVTIGKDNYDLPIMKGSMGAAGIDVRALHKLTDKKDNFYTEATPLSNLLISQPSSKLPIS